MIFFEKSAARAFWFNSMCFYMSFVKNINKMPNLFEKEYAAANRFRQPHLPF
jgi:hypothetical protein